MKRFRVGLVVGKFAPLHHGHEQLVAHATAECDELLILSWSKPEMPGCDPTRRERWLRERFPSARILVVDDARVAAFGLRVPANDGDVVSQRRFAGALCRDVLGTTVDAVFTGEDYGDDFAAEMTRFFGPAALANGRVAHVLVDRTRDAILRSATQIRADVHGHRAWLSDTVYADFVERVAILGGESSGKSTLTIELAHALGTGHVEEYGRELWVARDGKLAFGDMLAIAREQLAREDMAARSARRFLVCDTTPLTTLFYSREMFGRADPELEQLALREYRHTILCAPDFAFVQDGTRREPGFRELQHAWYVRELTRRGIEFAIASGTPAQRLAASYRRLTATPQRL